MRKILLLPILFLLLCGCGTQKSISPVTKGISFTADIVYGKETYVCDCSVSAAGKMTFSVKEPEDLNDLTLWFDGDAVTAKYRGLTYTPQTDRLPVGAVAQDLYDIMRTDRRVTESVKNCVMGGTVGGRSFTLRFSPTGFPLKAEIPDASYSVTFRNVTWIGK